MKKLYLAGPMTGYPEFNFPAFHAEAKRLRGLGFEVINPAELNGVGVAWVDCMRNDIRHLMSCQAVALLEGWAHSRGARLEAHIATELQMPVFAATEVTVPAGEFMLPRVRRSAPPLPFEERRA